MDIVLLRLEFCQCGKQMRNTLQLENIVKKRTLLHYTRTMIPVGQSLNSYLIVSFWGFFFSYKLVLTGS